RRRLHHDPERLLPPLHVGAERRLPEDLMASCEREGRYCREDAREEEPVRRSRPSPGKRSLTHSSGTGFAEVPPPGKVPATLNVTDEGVAPDDAGRTQGEATTEADVWA